MPRTGLNQEDIIKIAITLLDEKGFKNFSLRDLATRLNIKPASIYNHFSGIDDINMHLSIEIEKDMQEYCKEKTDGLKKDEAIIALGLSQYEYAYLYPNRYEVILALPKQKNQATDSAASRTAIPIMEILNRYQLSNAQRIHLHRMFRSFVHGCIALSKAGYLSHRDISTEESFIASLHYFIKIIHQLEREESSDDIIKK